MSISANSQEKPILDSESSQRLLAAAFMLQSQNDLRNENLTLEAPPGVRAIQGCYPATNTVVETPLSAAE